MQPHETQTRTQTETSDTVAQTQPHAQTQTQTQTQTTTQTQTQTQTQTHDTDTDTDTDISDSVQHFITRHNMCRLQYQTLTLALALNSGPMKIPLGYTVNSVGDCIVSYSVVLPVRLITA